MSNYIEKFRSIPFFRLLIPFILGILSGNHLIADLKWIILGLFLLSLAALFLSLSTIYHKEWRFGFVLFFTLFYLGLFIRQDKKYVPESLPTGNYVGVVNEFPIEKENTTRIKVRLIPSNRRILLYIANPLPAKKIEPGQIILFHGKPEILKNGGNPFEFDYAAFAIRNSVGHRIYLKGHMFFIIKGVNQPNLIEKSLLIREKLIRQINRSGLQGEVLHLVSAIVLGAREELEPETTKSFTNTGVVHVLAVSGMNVGIIYMVISTLLQFIKRYKWGKPVQLSIILIACWGYALITGLSSSVLRAAAMFSFIIIGKSLDRHANIYNMLAASAFTLLCFQPGLIEDVGFQLSYVAVLSIVYFYPSIYHLCYFKYWITDQIWSLLSVSMAAQIGTLPLILFYFHQFPIWFLLTNLMVIPLVTIILHLTFILLITIPIIPWLGTIMGYVLEVAGKAILNAVQFMEGLPHALIRNLYPSCLTLLLLSVIAVSLVVYVKFKNYRAFICALTATILLLLVLNIENFKTMKRAEIIIFNIPNKTLIATTTRQQTIWYTDMARGDSAKLKYYKQPYEGYRRIKKSVNYYFSDTLNLPQIKTSTIGIFLNFHELSLYILKDSKINNINRDKFPPLDIVLLPERSVTDCSKLLEHLPGIHVVALNHSIFNTDLVPHTHDNEKILNTRTGGAVLIIPSPKGKGFKNKFCCRYFNQ